MILGHIISICNACKGKLILPKDCIVTQSEINEMIKEFFDNHIKNCSPKMGEYEVTYSAKNYLDILNESTNKA